MGQGYFEHFPQADDKSSTSEEKLLLTTAVAGFIAFVVNWFLILTHVRHFKEMLYV